MTGTPFAYRRATDMSDALASGAVPGAAFLAGGTDLLQLWKAGLASPHTVVDLGTLPLHAIVADGDGLAIGALARLDDVAAAPAVSRDHPLIAQAILASASRQIRSMATIGGNLLQRTRCPYFRGALPACNKREPGSGCGARGGESRGAAIFGADLACVATHPSDLAVALAALDSEIEIEGPHGARTVPINAFYRRPGDPAQLDTHLAPAEVITAVRLQAGRRFAPRSTYLKVRDRASFEFAVVSIAAALDIEDGRIVAARLAAGGVAPGPRRLVAAETALVGRAPTDAVFRDAAELGIAGAEPFGMAGFKVALLRRSVVRALQTVGGTA